MLLRSPAKAGESVTAFHRNTMTQNEGGTSDEQGDEEFANGRRGFLGLMRGLLSCGGRGAGGSLGGPGGSGSGLRGGPGGVAEEVREAGNG